MKIIKSILHIAISQYVLLIISAFGSMSLHAQNKTQTKLDKIHEWTEGGLNKITYFEKMRSRVIKIFVHFLICSLCYVPCIAQTNVISGISQDCEVVGYIQEGDSCYKNGDYPCMIESYERAYQCCRVLSDSSSIIYCASKLYHAYFVTGNLLKAEEYETILLEGYRKCINREISIDSDVVLILFSHIADICKHHNQSQDAINIRLMLRNIEVEKYGSSDIRRFPNIYSLVSLCLDSGNYEGALNYIQEALSEIDYNDAGANLLDMQLLRVVVLADLGKVGEAIDLCETLKATHYGNRLEYYNILNIYAWVSACVGDFKKSLELRERTLPLTAEIYGEQSTYYATELVNLSEMYAVNEEPSKAIETSKKALDLMETIYGKDSPNYYHAYSKLCSRYAYLDKNKYQEMVEHRYDMAKHIFGENSEEYANALIYSVDLKEAPTELGISRIEKGLQIKKELGVTFNVDYFTQMSWLPVLYRERGDWGKVLNTCDSVLKLGKDFVIRNFINLREHQRELLWNMIKPAFDGIAQDAEQYVYYATETKDYSLYDKFSELAYNVRLFYKGVFLASTTELDRILSSSADEHVVALKSDIATLSQNLSQCIDTETRKAIETELELKEREILHIASQLSGGTFMNFADYDWEKVQKALRKNEIAIEFFSFPFGTDGDVQYAATWVGAEGFPKVCPLFNQSELSAARNTYEDAYDYKSPILYNFSWRLLEQFQEFRDAQTIYFSTDGILNSIAIENIVDSNNVIANDKWHLVRFSSTREIISKREKENQLKSVVLFGGLNYNMDMKELVSANQRFRMSKSATRYRANGKNRYGVEYLPYTLNEVEEIEELLRKNNCPKLELVTGNSGTEEAFRSLSGDTIDILHLATHGFFWDDETASNRSYIPYLNKSNNQQQSNEQLSMMHSGLLFSGANFSLKGGDLPTNIEDGILTAQELSELNLTNVEFAVLSACKTGLGLTASDGVFGLQRGFKLAGVSSLLMSLWNVSDEATSVMMAEFYKNYFSGASKIDALKAAQKKMRNMKMFSHPEYWAGWILLDAIN